MATREILVPLEERLDPDAPVIVLEGPSGAGKTTLACALYKAGIVDVNPTASTRPPSRNGEDQPMPDRIFLTNREFDRYSQNGEFLDEKTIYGHRYGIPHLRRPAEGREALIVLKPVFIPKFLAHYPKARVYLIDALKDILTERMHGRGQTEEDIKTRMQEYDLEMAEGLCYADATINNNGTVEEFLLNAISQINAERRDGLMQSAA